MRAARPDAGPGAGHGGHRAGRGRRRAARRAGAGAARDVARLAQRQAGGTSRAAPLRAAGPRDRHFEPAVAARALVADALSWHEAGVLQALWRTSDWICGLAWGVLSVFYLPKFAAAGPEQLPRVARRAFAAVVLPSGALLAALFAVHRPLLAGLYEPSFAASDGAVALLFAGSVARVASWVPLVALYAMRRTRAIAVGELLSLPLFAVLVALSGSRLTLEVAGVLWLVSFLAYCAFNLWAMRSV